MLRIHSFFAVVLLATLFVALPLSSQDKNFGQKDAIPPEVLKDEAAVRASVPMVAGLPASAEAAMKSIDPARIRTHVKFLASDLLEGRGTGARGGDIAAEYMASQFELYGLEPAGDDGTYLQKVPLVGITTAPGSTLAFVPEQGQAMELKKGDDYVVTDETGQPTDDVDAPVVFVGYGIHAPEYGWDDYKGVDMHGKVLLMLVNEPPSQDPKFFKGKALTYYGRWTYKYEEGARRGAAGVILVHKTEMASYGWDVVRNSWGGEKSFLEEQSLPRLHATGWIQLEVARRLATAAGRDLDQLMQAANSRDFQPVALPVRLKAHLVSQVRKFESSNVVAKLPGSEPQSREEAVMYTAHYDHLGIGPAVDHDNIYNGARDNATGCAILLEIARAYAAASQKPRRSVLFASVTAEEQGLLGSEYLGQHLPMAASRLTLDLNYDDVAPLGDPEELEAVGAERTTAYPLVEAVARDFRLAIVPDANPGAGHYYRSDHFSLARVGIPSFSINQGRKYKGHDRAWGDAQAKEFNSLHYHQPSDQYHASDDYSGDAVMARYGFALGWKAAAQSELIQWQPGDEFEAARRKSEQSSASGSR